MLRLNNFSAFWMFLFSIPAPPACLAFLTQVLYILEKCIFATCCTTRALKMKWDSQQLHDRSCPQVDSLAEGQILFGVWTTKLFYLERVFLIFVFHVHWKQICRFPLVTRVQVYHTVFQCHYQIKLMLAFPDSSPAFLHHFHMLVYHSMWVLWSSDNYFS